MKILIAYASATGTTEDCAQQLARELEALSPTVVSLTREIPDTRPYDLVLFGSCIRFGKLHPAARRFLTAERGNLTSRSLGIFLCCAFSQDFDGYYEKNIPAALRERTFAHLNFGGSLRSDRQGFFDRLLVRAMRSYLVESDIEDGEYSPTLPSPLPENVGVMATYVREEIKRLK